MTLQFPQRVAHPYEFECKCAECVKEHHKQVEQYQVAIRWMRQHGGWKQPKRKKRKAG